MFAAQVWAPERWRRGSPSTTTIRAHHRHVRCAASPGHRAAIKHSWAVDRHAYYKRRRHELYCRGGPVFAGRVSVFGPPLEGAGTTALGISSALPGIALYNYDTLGAYFRIRVAGHSAVLRQTDIGPAPWTGRTIDITGAGAGTLGLSAGGFPTDSWGIARLLPSDCA